VGVNQFLGEERLMGMSSHHPADVPEEADRQAAKLAVYLSDECEVPVYPCLEAEDLQEERQEADQEQEQADECQFQEEEYPEE
jgi:hypothetical protein